MATFNVDILIAHWRWQDDVNAYVSGYLKRFGNARVVALDPYLHSVLLNGGFEAYYIWHLLDDSQVQEQYRRARAFCSRLNETLSVDQKNAFIQLDLLNLSLRDFAYYATRYHYCVDWLARNICNQGVYSRLLIATINPSFMNARSEEITYTVKNLHHVSPVFKEARRRFVQLLSYWSRMDGARKRTHMFPKLELSTRTSLKRVLFAVTASDTLMDEMVVPPVLRCIQEENLLDPLVVTNSRIGANHLEKGNVTALYPSKDLSDETYPKAMEIVKRLKLECKRLLVQYAAGTPEFFTVCYYLDHLENYIAHACDYVAFLEEIFKEFRPDIVVMIPESTIFSGTAALLAKRNHVPSLSFYQLVRVHASYEDSYADRIALYGSHGYDAMIENGFSSSKLIAVGNPRYDDWLKGDADADRKTICEKLRIPHDRTIITIASHLAWEGTRTWVEAVVRTFTEHWQEGRYALILKPHPGDLVEDYLTILSAIKPSDAYLADRDADIRTLINASDVLMTDVSTVGVEAIVLGKPMICLNLTGTPQHLLRYDEEGGAILVTRADRIWDTIQDVLYDEVTREKLARERERGIERFALKNDGQSSARFLSAIHQLMAGNPK
jgi:hypothetical protein